MKKIISLNILLFVLIIGMSITSEASISLPTGKDNFQEGQEFNVNEAQLYYKSEIYDIDSVIDLSIILNLNNEILDYDLECNGFEVVNNVLIAKDIITFSVKYNGTEEKPYLNFILYLRNNVSLSKSLYGFLKQDKIFISRSSFHAAEQIYLDDLQERNIDEYERIRSEGMPCYDPTKPTNPIKLPSASLLASNPDTYVQGTFRWYDNDGNIHPLQFNRVELWDKEPIGETLMAYTYTDEKGYYRFEFNNADHFIEFENGGYDVFVRLLPMGENTRVYRGNGKSYQQDLGYWFDIPTGTTHYVSATYYMEEDSEREGPEFWANYDYEFAQALQVSQAAIFASKYVKEMNGKNIASASIRYPHNESSTGCFYSGSNKTIYIRNHEESQTLKSYASWDVIMHEYGHHVQSAFSIENSPGYYHVLGWRMGDHYKHHISGFPNSATNFERSCTECASAKGKVKESDCKLQGNRLAWGEGWPTYFAVVAQQYFSEKLTNINTVGDSKYTAYNGPDYSLTDGENEEEHFRNGDDCEVTVQSILYEMYDNSSDDIARDSLALGHKVMWDMTTGSKAKTFQEFDTYFRANYTDKTKLKYYGRILGHYNLAPSTPIASNISSFSPIFSWSWNPSDPSRYFNNTRYALNFYDYNCNLIGQSHSVSSTSLSPSDDLWTQVINSGYMFYVSVTRYEDNFPTSSYEGEWHSYQRPSAIQMSLSGKYTRELTTGDCYWFVFTAPQNATFIFETSGSTDTYGELFSQMVSGRISEGRITYNDDGGEGNNFKITYSMNKGNVVYLRVRGYNWDRTGEFILSISSPNHVHEFTYSYSSLNNLFHIARCCCGQTIQESHYFMTEKMGQRCKYCKYYTEGPIITPGELLNFIDNKNNVFLDEKRKAKFYDKG